MAAKIEQSGVRRSGNLRIRMKPEHLDLIREEANATGLSLSAWVVERLLKAVRKERRKHKKRLG